MFTPVRALASVGAAAVALATLPAAQVGASTTRQPLPWSVGDLRYGGKSACHVDAAQHRVRLWWSERNVQGRLPGSDGSCATLPTLVNFYRGHVGSLLTQEHDLGLPRPAGDSWLHDFNPFTGAEVVANGGSAALDVYLNGYVGTGAVQCTVGRTATGARTASYVMVATPVNLTRQSGAVYLTILAHELAHVGQCALHDSRGRNGTSGSGWVVEGTANMVAAAVMPAAQAQPDDLGGDPPLLDDDLVQSPARSPQRLFGAGSRSEAEGNAAYDSWPFWFALTHGGQSMSRLLTLYRQVASHPAGHRSGDLGVLRNVFTAGALQRALTAAATYDALAGRLATIDVPHGYWWWWRRQSMSPTPKQRIDNIADSPQTLDLDVPSGGVAWVRLRPAASDSPSLDVRVAGLNATGSSLLSPGVRVGDPAGHVVAPTSSGVWNVSVSPPPVFDVPDPHGATHQETGDAEAWVVFANAGTTTAKFRVTATATAPAAG